MSMDKGGIILIFTGIVLIFLMMLIFAPTLGKALVLVIGLPAAVIGLGVLIIEQFEKDAAKRRNSR